MTSKIQIDLRLKSLLEDLVNRKIVPAKWQESIRIVNQAMDQNREMLPQEAKALFSVNHKCNYFDAKEVVKYMEQSEEGMKRNFFGQYTSPILIAWIGIVKSYEKDNIFAAEIARLLQHNAVYEIPALKKTLQQNEKQMLDNTRKISDHHKSILEAKRKLAQECADLKIPGLDFRLELQALVYELPKLFQQIATTLCSPSLQLPCQYYQEVQDFLTSSTDNSSNKSSFLALRQLWSAPTSVLEDHNEGLMPVQTMEIKWDSEPLMESTSSIDIDWNLEPAHEIEWDITLENHATATTDVIAEEKKAIILDRVELLLDSAFRVRISNDLLELRSFLMQRRIELKTVNVALANQIQLRSPPLARYTATTMDDYIKQVNQAISALSDKRLQQLLLIKSSPRFLDRLVSTLEIQQLKIEKWTRQITILEEKNMEFQTSSAKIYGDVRAIGTRVKQLRKQFEEALSPLFKGNIIRIVGDIGVI